MHLSCIVGWITYFVHTYWYIMSTVKHFSPRKMRVIHQKLKSLLEGRSSSIARQVVEHDPVRYLGVLTDFTISSLHAPMGPEWGAGTVRWGDTAVSPSGHYHIGGSWVSSKMLRCILAVGSCCRAAWASLIPIPFIRLGPVYTDGATSVGRIFVNISVVYFEQCLFHKY